MTAQLTQLALFTRLTFALLEDTGYVQASKCMILRTVHINFVNTDRQWGFRECKRLSSKCQITVKRRFNLLKSVSNIGTVIVELLLPFIYCPCIIRQYYGIVL